MTVSVLKYETNLLKAQFLDLKIKIVRDQPKCKIKVYSVFAVLSLWLFTFHAYLRGFTRKSYSSEVLPSCSRLAWLKKRVKHTSLPRWMLSALIWLCFYLNKMGQTWLKSSAWHVCVIYCCVVEQWGWMIPLCLGFFRNSFFHVSQFSWNQLNSSLMWWVRLEEDRRGFVSSKWGDELVRYDAGQPQNLNPDCINQINILCGLSNTKSDSPHIIFS